MRDEPDNNDSDEEGQAYYAGGADHGRQVYLMGGGGSGMSRGVLFDQVSHCYHK